LIIVRSGAWEAKAVAAVVNLKIGMKNGFRIIPKPFSLLQAA